MKKIKTLLLAMMISSVSFATPKAFVQLLGMDNGCYTVLVFIADVDNNGNITSIIVQSTYRMCPDAINQKNNHSGLKNPDFENALKFPEINQAVADYLNRQLESGTYPIDENAVKVFPNPSGSSLQVSLSMKESANVNLLLFSLDGKLIDLYNAGKLSGTSRIRYSIPDKVSAGNYMLIIQAGDQNMARQISIR